MIVRLLSLKVLVSEGFASYACARTATSCACAYSSTLASSCVTSSTRRATPSAHAPWQEETLAFHSASSQASTSPRSGPFEEDRVRSGLQQNYPGASPCSAGKLLTFKRQLFDQPSMITRGMAQTSSSVISGPSPLSTQELTQEAPSMSLEAAPLGQEGIQPLPNQGNNHILQLPANPRRPRDRPDLEDVVTQQTELLAAMLERLNQRPAPAAALVIWMIRLQTRPSYGDDWPCHQRRIFQCLGMVLSSVWPLPSSRKCPP